jgi:hypothetical protein
MAIQKKSLIGAGAAKQRKSETSSDQKLPAKSGEPSKPAHGKKLALAKLATAKLSTAKLTVLRKLT